MLRIGFLFSANVHAVLMGLPIAHGLQSRRSPLYVGPRGFQMPLYRLRRDSGDSSFLDYFVPVDLPLALHLADHPLPSLIELPDMPRLQLLRTPAGFRHASAESDSLAIKIQLGWTSSVYKHIIVNCMGTSLWHDMALCERLSPHKKVVSHINP